MEHFLSCYLDQFNQLPRSSLHDRRKRSEMVDYISTLIEGCSKGDNSVEQTARQAVLQILRYHELNRNLNGTVCMMGKFHNILYVAVKICFKYRVKDSSIVTALLDHIYSCEGTFERLLVGAVFGSKAPFFLAGWKSDFDDQKENVRAVEYFLDHSNNGLFEVSLGDGKFCRFVDVPIESCGRASPSKLLVQLGQPELLLVFLRYGALVVEENEVFQIILDKLLEFKHCYPFNLVACLQALLRVVPALKPDEKYEDLVQDCIVPLWRNGLTPPELKHLTRIAIRRQLWRNFQLPAGIQSLPIPSDLRQYVDLLKD